MSLQLNERHERDRLMEEISDLKSRLLYPSDYEQVKAELSIANQKLHKNELTIAGLHGEVDKLKYDSHLLFKSELQRRWPLEYRWSKEWDTCETVKDFMEWLKYHLSNEKENTRR